MNSYIHKIFVHHNYVEKHFEIDLSIEDKKGFKNLILTGKNGSGKSTLLKALNKELFLYKTGIIPSNPYYNVSVNNSHSDSIKQIEGIIFKNPKVEVQFGHNSDFLNEDLLVIYIPTSRLHEFGTADRKTKLNLISSLNNQNKKIQTLKNNNLKIANEQRQIFNYEKQIENHQEKASKLVKDLQGLKKGKDPVSINKIQQQLSSERTQIANKTKALNTKKGNLNTLIDHDSNLNPYTVLAPNFLQYLIEIKERQAFAIADDEQEIVKETTNFFKNLEKLFRILYEDNSLKIKHSFKENRFYFEFKNGIQAEFNQIADGFKSVLVIVSEIMLQKEAFIQSKKLSSDPTGIVIIDELGAHLHLSIQEKILPCLTDFFPKLQFILSTHSPQICASDLNTYCYNISSKYLEREFLGGVSYDVIAKAHFGLKSEFSNYTTDLIEKVKTIMKKEQISEEEKAKLENLSKELGSISPELTYELDLFLNKTGKND